MPRILIVAACAAALAACTSSPSGQAAAVLAQAQSQAPAASADYLRMAAASDLYEILSSQLMLQSSQNASLRRFAQMMIEHHTDTTATLAAAATSAGMTPPAPALNAEQRAMVQALQAASGVQRDQLYLSQQIEAHRQALVLHGAYADGGDTAELRRAAASAAPIVANHYNSLMALGGGGDHARH